MSESVTKHNYSVPHADQAEMTQKIHPRLTQIMPNVFEAGELLHRVHKKHLWLVYADSFKEYCENFLDMTRQRVYQLMTAYEVRESLPEERQPVVDTERKARALVDVPPKQRPRVVDVAVEASNGRPTARHIEEAAERVTAPKPAKAEEKKVVLDSTGWPIPPNLEHLFDRTQEVRTYLTQISAMRGMIRRVQENKDQLWRSVNYSAAAIEMDKLFAELKEAVPFAVCPYCSGHEDTRSHCATCKQRGAVSEHFWKHAIPEEIKAIRAKSSRK